MSQKPQTVFEYTQAIHDQNALIMSMFEELKLNSGSQDQARELEARLNEAQEKIEELQEKLSSTSELLNEISIAYKGEMGEDITSLVNRFRKVLSEIEADNTDEADDDEL